MYVQNLDKLTFLTLILEVSIIQALKNKDIDKYIMFAECYRYLADACSNATLEWS